ncbi:ribosomal peptide maturation radical SAM protein 1 [Jatrophihabitans sp. GAS493]|uniref:RiPP maturation radical SAM C-methyltransferase n=1 Tax=Jatrophihabitans sp. GAS493 TaxID=1907575 RepID=UPI000BB98761|nr:RiPP maturation radical SAM C-methyltransferase [Jatrophihabitans sp. GAS493]SOD73602.1 ribosomal peptide maturation radical SAM protein 1 [Jatrophihabitans sp. GAS493]
MQIALVNMPWALIDVPSLAVGILGRSARQTLPDARVNVVHANLEYVDWLCERRQFALGDYHFLALESYFAGLGDWVFSSALYDDPQWRVEHIGNELSYTPEQEKLSLELHASAGEFIDDLVTRILADRPDVVGFTSTFQQNTASLAAARVLKQRAPHVITMMGGANCDGAQGAAVARNFTFVDFVVRGEGEHAFPALLLELDDARRENRAPAPEALARIDGLCWRDATDTTNTVIANDMSRTPLAPAEIVAPDYDGYFERLEASIAHDWVEPKLVLEGARGCWWGEKHHCTFCGLNGTFMQFRSKSPTKFYDEIIEQVRRHQVMDMFIVDNILDMNYLRSLIPALAESGYDLRLQYEIKSNLKRPQLAALADAGLVNVQPGIESLSTSVLKIMDKGVTGALNVRMLRDAASVGLSVSWNYLFGFPGEESQDYEDVLAQMPALHHLPPLEAVARIAIERFSPFFDRPELGFGDARPDPQYRRTYDLPEEELRELAYLFTADPHGIDDELSQRLHAAARVWQDGYPDSTLTHVDLGEEILLVSHRKSFDWTVHWLRDRLELAMFRLLDQPHSVASLHDQLRKSLPTLDQTDVDAVLGDWRDLGIVFTDNGQYIQVAPEATNQELVRFARTYEFDPDPETGADTAAAEPVLEASR